MFECKYKLELEDNLISAKYVYKSQRRTKDKVIAVLIPILLISVIAMLVYDIILNKSIVWDVILLVALVFLQGMYWYIPIALKKSQNKSFYSQKLDTMDYYIAKIDENLCVEAVYKDDKEQYKNTHNLRTLTSYIEDENRLIMVFNNVEFVCIRKANLKGGLENFKNHLEKVMSKQMKNKK